MPRYSIFTLSFSSNSTTTSLPASAILSSISLLSKSNSPLKISFSWYLGSCIYSNIHPFGFMTIIFSPSIIKLASPFLFIYCLGLRASNFCFYILFISLSIFTISIYSPGMIPTSLGKLNSFIPFVLK